MPQFVVEVSMGGAWTPVLIWNVSNIRAALLKLDKHCTHADLNIDTHRIKPLKTPDEIIDANNCIKANKKGHHG